MAKNTINDFDKSTLMQTIVNYGENLNIIAQKIQSLEQRVGDDLNFGKSFSKACLESIKIEESIQGILVKLLEANKETKVSVSKIVENLDRNAFKRFINKIGFGIWTIITITIGVMLDKFLSTH